MLSKILFGIEVVALIAAPVGYLKLREYRAEQFFDKGNAALQAGDWGQAYAYYQEAARRDNDAVKASVACRLTLCKDFGLGVAPAAQIENCPLHGDAFSDCLVASKVSAKLVFEAAKQRLADVGSTDLIIWVATTYLNGSSSQSRYNAVYTNNYLTVPQDYDEAAAWYRMAAVRGRLDAQRQLIAMAYRQQWEPSPEELPSAWLLNMKDMLMARILLGRRIAAGDEALAKHPEASDWLLAAANDGNAAAQACIGIKLAEGEHFLTPQETATNYVLAAARQGNEKAQAQIVELAQRNIYRDARWDTLPTEWLLAAAKQGNEKAQIRIVELIQAGLYMEANWGDLPIAWLIAAAQNNNEAAQAHLGAKLAEGETLDLPEETVADCLLATSKQGNKKAQQALLPIAKQGNEKVQAYLGAKLADGESLNLQETIANDCLLAAAKQGNKKAHVRIVNMVLGRKCTLEMEQKTVPILLSSARNGNLAVQAYLGTKLAEGKTFPIPSETANDYLLFAAQQGNENAQVKIVNMAQSGLYTDTHWKDLPVEWLFATAKQGNEKAKAYFLEVAKKGDIQAQIQVVELAHLGIYSWKDIPMRWFSVAAKQGDQAAKQRLEQAFANKEWKKATDEETFRALFPYAEAGVAAAQNEMAERYLYGIGIPQSNEKAREWYRKAAKNGDSAAQWRLNVNGWND